MHVIEVTNVNQGLAAGLRYLAAYGVEESSRNGPVLVAPGPVTTVYHRPWERVLFSPLRDANPFFHVMEAIWMLAGRDDVDFPAYFNSNFTNYSDDGKTVHGAYGKRWRSWFGYDQLLEIAEELRRNPASRRCVLTMWDGAYNAYPSIAPGNFKSIPGDFHTAIAGGKDVPCNTHAYFDVRGGKLNITVCCRSNDIWWGCYGANAVHFSVLQEYMAALVDVPMGVYRQVSNNYHLYTNVVPRARLEEFARDAEEHDYTYQPSYNPAVFVEHAANWTPAKLEHWINGGQPNASFLAGIAEPMRQAYRERKEKMGTGRSYIEQMPPCDWRIACLAWITRREKK